VNNELRRSNEELEQFAYVVSHDLQEPLRQVISFSGLIKQKLRDKVDPSTEELLNFIVDGGMRMNDLISDLLVYSRVGRGDSPKVLIAIEEAVNLAILNLKTSIDEAEATIVCDQLPSLPVNVTQITQVFQNLIGNAIKFRSEKKPEIYIRAEQRDSFWLFSVRDNGIGFNNEDVRIIFNIFQRLHSTDKYKGSGIGLAICRRIIELHGGHVCAESSPGHGATFYFTLPVR